MKFKPKTHKTCLYTIAYGGKQTYFLRQVYNFAIACDDERTAQIIISDINSHMLVDVKYIGLTSTSQFIAGQTLTKYARGTNPGWWTGHFIPSLSQWTWKNHTREFWIMQNHHHQIKKHTPSSNNKSLTSAKLLGDSYMQWLHATQPLHSPALNLANTPSTQIMNTIRQ